MARAVTVSNEQDAPYYFNVCFRVRQTGKTLIRSFEAEPMAYKFVNKLKRSKRCVLIYYPLFK